MNEAVSAAEPGTPHQESSASNSNSNSNTHSSGRLFGPTNGTYTTTKTSLDSKFSKLSSSKETNSGDKKLKPTTSIVRRREPELDPKPDSPLEPIAETVLDHSVPTVLTVEKTAAVKIYLETYYNDLLQKPSPRSLRLQYLEAELYHAAGLTPQEQFARRQMFFQKETAHLREMRVLKARSAGATIQGLPNRLADKYEVLKVLGKGSFGVVRLVREKPVGSASSSHSAAQRKAVYAMKVIRKSTMLRTSQEGHLRAERDFLVSSEGSRWYVDESSYLAVYDHCRRLQLIFCFIGSCH